MSTELKLFIIISIVFVLLFGALLLFMIIYVRRQIKNRKEIEEVRRKSEAALLRATLTAQEIERERIGANLHDDIGPLLSSIKIFFKSELKKNEHNDKEEITAFLEALDENIEHVRDVSRDMVPNVLKNFGLKAALEEIIRRFSKDSSIQFNLKMDKDVNIPDDSLLPVYRIIQESITNSIRHGHANKIQIELLKENGYLLKISDNGEGFDVSESKSGLGLRNIEARAKAIDATFHIESAIRKGTVVKIKSIYT